MKRILKYGQDDARLFELTYESLAIFRPGPGRNERRQRTESLLGKLEAGSREREQGSGNPDLALRTLAGPASYELGQAEHDLLVEAVDAIDWPAFASRQAGRARALLMDAERVE